MRISLNWLRDYLDLKPDTDVLHITETLTMAGLEVESIERLKDKVKGLLVAVVKEKVNESDPTCYTVVVDEKILKAHGPASDLKPNTLVAFSPNSKVQKGFHGTLVTLNDLGLANSQEILCLGVKSEDELAANLSLMPEFDDVIITLGITPNRADALSHLGVSRELSALLDLPMRAPSLSVREMAGPTHE
ncbi:MAG TPA: hypothetical protein VEK06_01775, partial [Myxococcota bacterium]|nr:hypothetical protein [Myxococcota bacterium]